MTAPTPTFERAEAYEAMPAGAGTSREVINGNAFSHPLANLGFEEQQRFLVGNGLFRKAWVSAPASTQASDGLGPLFNARSCQGCHLKDGRGHPPKAAGEPGISMFLRLSLPPGSDEERRRLASKEFLLVAEPTYGGQLQHLASNLAAPARRDTELPEVPTGKALFYQAGCSSCHTPKYVTRRDAAQEAHRFQLIWPYTDLLLHDMGEGLANGQTVGDASGREWRTPPLWGIGLTETVNGHTLFLHDGRACNLLEAILWHGGEAQEARDKVVAMKPEERSPLIRFLESL